MPHLVNKIVSYRPRCRDREQWPILWIAPDSESWADFDAFNPADSGEADFMRLRLAFGVRFLTVHASAEPPQLFVVKFRSVARLQAQFLQGALDKSLCDILPAIHLAGSFR